MKNYLLVLMFYLLSFNALALAVNEPELIYWDSAAGKTLHSRIPADADYWQLIPNFAVQSTQSYCSVASAITVLNSMPIAKPVDPAYAPYAYFTQSNFFTPEVSKIISAQAVLEMGMTRGEMVKVLTAEGVHVNTIAGDSINDKALRTLLKKALGDDGQYVLVNYLRAKLGQAGAGHWSVLAAYDAKSDKVLILDVAKYKYPPVWVSIRTLLDAINTLDSTSNKSRGLVLVGK
jgi:Phytochelatin synthase